jgi:acetoin utilization deacetylase AcuC-like enzyme
VNTVKGETYECKETFEAAKLAAAATITGLRKILDGQYERGYAIVRPPGHHAYQNKAAGFCFFNNVAIAAKLALNEPYNLKRVCVFDWDIHHGDGT